MHGHTHTVNGNLRLSWNLRQKCFIETKLVSLIILKPPGTVAILIQNPTHIVANILKCIHTHTKYTCACFPYETFFVKCFLYLKNFPFKSICLTHLHHKRQLISGKMIPTQEFGEGAKSNVQNIFKYDIFMNSKFNNDKNMTLQILNLANVNLLESRANKYVVHMIAEKKTFRPWGCIQVPVKMTQIWYREPK